MGTNIPLRAQVMRASGGVFVPFTVLVSLVTFVIQSLIASCNQKIRLSVWTDAENDYIN